MGSFTPMIEQYHRIRERYPDCLLFFRLGDFYELFEHDAEVAARELQIVLTSREIGKNQKTPMCGIPYHAADSYLKRLLDRGHRVAICEQLEEPKPGKGIVKRDVVRVVTPGTMLNPEYLDQTSNNYLIALQLKKDKIGCAWSDISTGRFFLTQFSGPGCSGYLVDLFARLQPVECLVKEEQLSRCGPEVRIFWEERGMHLTPLRVSLSRDEAVDLVTGQFGSQQLLAIDLEAQAEGMVAAGHLLSYIKETQKSDQLPFHFLSLYTPEHSMYLDAMTRRNLEIFSTMREGKGERTLYWALDRTVTAMGARLLRQWLEFPLLEPAAIEERQQAVEEMADNYFLRDQIGTALGKVYDLERIIGRVEWQIANPRDLLALAKSLAGIPELQARLLQGDSGYLRRIGTNLNPVEKVRQLIFNGIVDNPPLSSNDMGVIRNGYDTEVDRLRRLLDEGENWIKDFETAERERSGIKSLKVGYNKIFGYYIEVTKTNLDSVPENYIRKQTLVQAERFITPELQEREALFTGASEQLKELEKKLFRQLLGAVANAAQTIRSDASLLAQLDCLYSFAETAARFHYIRPRCNDKGVIRIKNGRHPVLEQILGEGEFIPNDLELGGPGNRIHLITGPNMAGKSTYMRQMALLVLMAHCGSLIPAEEAEIGLVDRIFVRAGAMDDLGRGQSTFMMEMSEVSYILSHATAQSLVILDEIGRGTSTCDGLGIAWAIVEYLHDRIGARALFATHYHQLNQLEERLEGVTNYSVAVAEEGEEITFLRRVVPGGTDRSYGIQVARLAALPKELVERARQVAETMESAENATSLTAAAHESSLSDGTTKTKTKIQPGRQESRRLDHPGSGTEERPPSQGAVQLVLFDDENIVLNELRGLDLLTLTPLQALNQLSEWQQRLGRPADGHQRKAIVRKRGRGD